MFATARVMTPAPLVWLLYSAGDPTQGLHWEFANHTMLGLCKNVKIQMICFQADGTGEPLFRSCNVAASSLREAHADIHHDQDRQKDDAGPTSKRFTAQFHPGREGHPDEDQGKREACRECCGL